MLEVPAAVDARWTQHEAQKCVGAHQPVLLAASRHYRRGRTKAGADRYARSEALRSRVRCAVLAEADVDGTIVARSTLSGVCIDSAPKPGSGLC